MFKRVTVLAALVLFAFASAAEAQQKGTIEIGADNAIGYVITSKFQDAEVPDALFATVPFGTWRLGFFINEQFSIEPSLGFDFVSLTDDAGSAMALDFTADVVYNMPSGLFFHGGGILTYARQDPGGDAETESESQFGFGAGVGYRYQLVDMLYLRIGARGFYLLESEDDGLPSSLWIAGTFGFSFMTK
ncbi:MAG: outer membrane beta-barrel protein [Gemmatimonadetes bacterium]|nr:outer membrane beta-barrel protein [Gemmatimonadota bacterium]NIO32693.1 outer membrane beta-barrel protein [Gemmatimonadota bacterium]